MEKIYTLSGIVQKHLGRGRTLGYPTANIEIFQDIPEGLYVGTAILESVRLPSLIFVGASSTFGETEKRCEVYILDFNKDIYGKKISVEIYEKIRDNKAFESAEELVEQMKKDEKEARKWFAR